MKGGIHLLLLLVGHRRAVGENFAAAGDRICPQSFSSVTRCPHTPSPSPGTPAGPVIPVLRTSARQSWQAGCGCLAAQTRPCLELRADPEDEDALDTVGCVGICVVSREGQPGSGLWTLAWPWGS